MHIRNLLMVASLVLSVLIGAVVARSGKTAGGAAATGNGPLPIGFSMDTPKEARWQADRDAFVKRAEELGAKAARAAESAVAMPTGSARLFSKRAISSSDFPALSRSAM